MNSLPYDETIQCVQCGYCLPACPTYLSKRTETHSPRGRINLVKLAAEGVISYDELKEPIDLCLGCRACETACPSGVKYGKILEETREALYHNHRENSSLPFQRTQDLLFRKVIPSSKQITRGANLLWFYQSSGLQKLARKTKLTDVLPGSLSSFEKILPEAASPAKRKKRAAVLKPSTSPKWKIAFFTGCIMDGLFEKVNSLSLELLKLAGCEVHVIPEQTCCGALHAHSGRKQDAIQLAKKNIAAFEEMDIDYIVNNAGGCGAMLAEYDKLLENDEEWAERAHAFVQKTRDISQILRQCELPLGNVEMDRKVTYQPSCHMTNVQGVVDEPLQLLESIPGVIFKPLSKAEMCCGSAGIYNLVHFHESMKILDEKMKGVEQDVEMIVTTNPGCLLQMRLGVHREKLEEKIEVVHLVELIAASCGLTLTDE